MKKKTFARLTALSLTASILVSMTGCSRKIQSADLMDDIEAQTVNEITDMEEYNSGAADFAVRLFQECAPDGGNTLISPLSVFFALAMTANGAENETLSQMETVLGMPVDSLNPYIYSYLKDLPQSKKCSLSLANSIWFTDDERFTVKQDFLQANADYYGADIYETCFDDNSALNDINNWVRKKTDGRISEIIDIIPDSIIMYLVNAVAFEAEWENIYREDQIAEDIFTLEDGTQKTVSFMYNGEDYYLEDDHATGFIKYYEDRTYAFVALLPDESLTVREYIDSLTGEHIRTLLSNPIEAPVNTSIPKFETEYRAEMSSILTQMGMTMAFDEDYADFSGLGTSTGGNIFLNRVLHSTCISVDERGTEAGAASAIEMTDSTGLFEAEEVKTVYLNRPFVYMVIDCKTSLPVFMGTMMDVSGE